MWKKIKNKVTSKEFAQAVAIELAADSIMVVTGLIVVYYIKVMMESVKNFV